MNRDFEKYSRNLGLKCSLSPVELMKCSIRSASNHAQHYPDTQTISIRTSKLLLNIPLDRNNYRIRISIYKYLSRPSLANSRDEACMQAESLLSRICVLRITPDYDCMRLFGVELYLVEHRRLNTGIAYCISLYRISPVGFRAQCLFHPYLARPIYLLYSMITHHIYSDYSPRPINSMIMHTHGLYIPCVYACSGSSSHPCCVCIIMLFIE